MPVIIEEISLETSQSPALDSAGPSAPSAGTERTTKRVELRLELATMRERDERARAH